MVLHPPNSAGGGPEGVPGRGARVWDVAPYRPRARARGQVRDAAEGGNLITGEHSGASSRGDGERTEATRAAGSPHDAAQRGLKVLQSLAERVMNDPQCLSITVQSAPIRSDGVAGNRLRMRESSSN